MPCTQKHRHALAVPAVYPATESLLLIPMNVDSLCRVEPCSEASPAHSRLYVVQHMLWRVLLILMLSSLAFVHKVTLCNHYLACSFVTELACNVAIPNLGSVHVLGLCRLSTHAAMLRGTHRCSGLLLRQLASRAAASSSGAGTPILASALAPLACSFTSFVTPAAAGGHTAAHACALLPAHSFHTSVRHLLPLQPCMLKSTLHAEERRTEACMHTRRALGGSRPPFTRRRSQSQTTPRSSRRPVQRARPMTKGARDLRHACISMPGSPPHWPPIAWCCTQWGWAPSELSCRWRHADPPNNVCLSHQHRTAWAEQAALQAESHEACTQSSVQRHVLLALLTCRFISPHPGSPDEPPTDGSSYLLMHPVYSMEYLESIHPRHKTPETVRTQKPSP